jgi:hypothetical protein
MNSQELVFCQQEQGKPLRQNDTIRTLVCGINQQKIISKTSEALFKDNKRVEQHVAINQ